MNASQSHEHDGPAVTTLILVFAALVLLLAVTVGLAELNLGRWNFVAATGIAVVKTILILLFFMHVLYSEHLVWIVAGAGFLWLSILIGMTLADYISRGWTPLG